MRPGHARVGGWHATELVDRTDDPAALDSTGRWVVAQTFEGGVACARFGQWTSASTGPGLTTAPFSGPARESWTSSLDAPAYVDGVERIRREIAAGEVYQVNLCRVLSAPHARVFDAAALWDQIVARNPAPYCGLIVVPEAGLYVVSASPELFLRRRGDVVESSPIKGTGVVATDLGAKDRAENVMIVDLVRNDLSRVCDDVDVPRLLDLEAHPGLVHLVSTVRARLRPHTSWAELLAATTPPGSVSGAPKSSALRLIAELEPVPRQVYCGALGWVDADSGDGELAVAIRTFWWRDGVLFFGTGAGITWGSDPAAEWAETELKAARLLEIASQ
jgi:para-aminobenzoate synthetase component I